MANIKGKIEQVAESKTKSGKPKYGVRIGTVWYNGWGDAPEGIAKGLEVNIDYDTNDYGNNIKKIVPSETKFTPGNEVKHQETAKPAPQSKQDLYWERKEERDIIGAWSARRGGYSHDAAAIVAALISAGHKEIATPEKALFYCIEFTENLVRHAEGREKEYKALLEERKKPDIETTV